MSNLALIFSGHMIDLPGRGKERFPAALEPAARRSLARAVAGSVAARSTESIAGFASLARGGDILFHEVCRAHGLRTVVVLPFSPERFMKGSVNGVPGGNWPKRFRALWAATIAKDRFDLGLPETDEAYAACNEHLLGLAQAHGSVHLIALWDGGGGDGPGGTADLVQRMRAQGDEPSIIDPAKL